MKLKVLKSSMLDGLKYVRGIASQKSTVAILSNIKIVAQGDKSVELTSTNLNITIKTNVSCAVLEGGMTTLPASLLSNAIQRFPDGEIDIEVDENDKAILHGGTAQYRINGLRAADFPTISEEDLETSDPIKFNQAVFGEMMKLSSYAASVDDTRKSLKGVGFFVEGGKATMVATDGRRLSFAEYCDEGYAGKNIQFTIPNSTVSELAKIVGREGEMEVSKVGAQVKFSIGGVTTLYSKLIDEPYPNYRLVIPDYKKDGHVAVSVSRDDLIRSVDLVAVMADDTACVNFDFKDNALVVSCLSKETNNASRDIIPIKYDGENISVNLNPKFVSDILKNLSDDDIVFNVKDGSSPVVVTCSIPFCGIMMPLRVM